MATHGGNGRACIEQHHAGAIAAIAVSPIHRAAVVGQHIHIGGLCNVTG